MHLKSVQKEVFLLGSEGDTLLLIVSSVPSLSSSWRVEIWASHALAVSSTEDEEEKKGSC